MGVLNGNDLLLLALFIPTVPAYLQQRLILLRSSPWFRRLEAIWVIFVILIIVSAYRSPAYTLTDRFVNMRYVEICVLFFPSVAILTSVRRLRIVAIAGLLFAIIGTLVTIAQSLHGLQNLFNSPFYNIGAWNGNKQLVGGIARVNLPISDWIAFVLLVLAAASFRQFRWWRQAVGGLLFITILLNFARSLWLGMFAALLLEVALLWRFRSLDFRSTCRAVAMPIMVIIGIVIAPFFGFGGILGAVTGRLAEGKYFFLTGSGTYGARLGATAYALDLWRTAPWWGLGTPYINATTVPIDVAYAVVLVSIGIVGFCVVILLYGICFMAALSALRQGVRDASSELIIIGLAVAAEITLILIYQQWVNFYCIAIMGFVSALTVNGPIIYHKPESERDPERRRIEAPSVHPVPGMPRSGSLPGVSSSRDFTAGSI